MKARLDDVLLFPLRLILFALVIVIIAVCEVFGAMARGCKRGIENAVWAASFGDE